MSMESDLHALLAGLGVPAFPDVVEGTAPASYITYQHIGGPAWRYLDNTPVAQRRVTVQINAWAQTRSAATALIRQVEEALCAATAFDAQTIAEPLDTTDDANPRRYYGCIQDFDIQALR